MKVKELFAFIHERHSIYERRKRGDAKPWTSDSILRAYRFCNVYRELDKVTTWIRENWREPNAADPDLWFAMVVARLLNLPASMEELNYPVPFDRAQFKRTLRRRKERGDTVFSGAYMIHADAEEGWLKTDYLAERVLAPLWKDRADVRPRKTDTLAQFHARLMTYRDMGSFMAAQVVADTKFHGVLAKATDWWTWAAPGPGSTRGMNRITGRDIKTRWEDDYWWGTLNELGVKINVLAHTAGMPRISAQDLQNCLCEWDKYERARLGEGRPKQRYAGV